MSDTERLTETVVRFCQFIEGLPESALLDQDWGPKEVLAHLVYHHELYVRLVEAFLAGEPVDLPRGRFSDINASAVTMNKEVPVAKLINRFMLANQRFVFLYQQHDPNIIILQIKAGAKLRTLAGLITEVEAHIRNHYAKLMKGHKRQICKPIT